MKLNDGTCSGHLLVYVDDMLLLTEPEVAQTFIEWLRVTWECTGLKEATAEEPLRFLGVDIYAELDESGSLVGYSLAQESYIAELLRAHDVRSNSKATAPVPKEWVRDLPPEEAFTEHELRSAQKITGELLWLAQRSRIDIAYTVGLMASWVARYPKQVSKIGLRLLEYLGNTKANRLFLIPRRSEGLRIFTDASFAPHGSHSISGIALQYDECCVVWKSKRQSLVTLSTAESELVSGCEGVVLGQSLEALICELEESRCSKHLMVDNTAAVTLAAGGGSQRTRHLRVRSAFIRDMIDRNEIQVEHCPGDVQLADCLTKALMKTRLDDLCSLLGLGPPRNLKVIAKVVAQDSNSPTLSEHSCESPTRVEPCRPTQEPCRVGIDGDNLRVWLIALVLLLQAELGEGHNVGEAEGEPLSLELSLLVVLMILSVLFLWESSKYCVRGCCNRHHYNPTVRMVDVDEEGEQRQLRKERRQESVRRAIERELDNDGLRQRPVHQREWERQRPAEAPFLRVQVEAQPYPPALDLPPPPPPYPSDAEVPTPAPPTSGFSDSYSGVQPPSSSSSLAPEIRSSLSSRVSEAQTEAKRDASTQTTFDQGFTFEELCELHVITTSSRTPGALHFFRSCQALRNTTAVQDRMICRYCLQALRDGRT